MAQDERASRTDERELLRRWLLIEDGLEAGRVTDEEFHVMEDAVTEAFGPMASFVLGDQIQGGSAEGSLADLAADPVRLDLLLDAIVAARPEGLSERKKSWVSFPAGRYYWSAGSDSHSDWLAKTKEPDSGDPESGSDLH